MPKKTVGISRFVGNSYFWSLLLDKYFPGKFEVKPVEKLYIPDFIIFDGGSDVTPYFYGRERHIFTQNNIDRDLYEQDLFLRHLDKDTLFFGICRGNQFLNVMHGGTLIQHLGDFSKNQHYHHYVSVINEGDITNYVKGEILVNSTHHQAIENVGKDCIVTLFDENKQVIEGFESINKKTRAVQCHPESLDFPVAIKLLAYLLRE